MAHQSLGFGNFSFREMWRLENPMERVAWQAAVRGISMSQTWLRARRHTPKTLKKKTIKVKAKTKNNNNRYIIGNKASPQMIIIQCILMQQPCKKSVCLSIYLSHWFLFLDHMLMQTQKNKRELSLPVQEVWISLRVNSTEIDLLYCLTMSKDLWYPISSLIVFVIGKERNSGSGSRSARFGVEGLRCGPL